MMRNFLCKSLGSLWASLPLCGLVCLLNPALVLYSEPNEFMLLFWLQLAIFAFGAATVLGLFVSLLPSKLNIYANNFLLCLFFVCFIATVFYPTGVNLLDGSVYETIPLTKRIVIYSCYAVAMIFFGFLLAKKSIIAKRLVIMSACLGAGFIAYVAFQQIQFSMAMRSEPISRADMSFGTHKNVVIILADMLQGSAVEQALKLHTEIEKEYKDFTVYTRAVSAFPFTRYSLPSILSGKTYSDGPRPSSENSNFSVKDSFLTDAEKAGFSYVAVGKTTHALAEKNFYHYPSQPNVFGLISLSLIRILKKDYFSAILEKNVMMESLLADKRIGIRMIFDLAAEAMGTDKDKVIFLHNMTPHNPVYFSLSGADLYEDSRHVMEFQTNKHYLDELGSVMKLYAKVFSKMKDLGIYDNSLIVIVGDHGHFQGAQKSLYQDFPGAEDFAGYSKGLAKRNAGMYNPAIFVKAPRVQQEQVKISREATTITDIRRLVGQYLDDTPDITEYSLPALRNLSTEAMEVVVFTKETPSPYTYPDAHTSLFLTGNIATLPGKLAMLDLPYITLNNNTSTSYAISVNEVSGAIIPESGSFWIKDEAIHIPVRLPDYRPSNSYKFVVHGLPLIKSGVHDRQRIHLQANGRDAGVLLFTGEARFGVDIPSDWIRADGAVHLTLTPLDPISPSALGFWCINDELSLSVRKVEIRETSTDFFRATANIPATPANSEYFFGRQTTEHDLFWVCDGLVELPIEFVASSAGGSYTLEVTAMALPGRRQSLRVDLDSQVLGIVSFGDARETQRLPLPANMLQESVASVLNHKFMLKITHFTEGGYYEQRPSKG